MSLKKTRLAVLLMTLLVGLSLLVACGAGTAEAEAAASGDVDGELIVDHEEQLQYAQQFTMTHYKGGYISFRILGGEHEDRVYLVVPEGKTVPAGLGEEYVVLQQPVTNLRCCSGSASTISAFGGLDRVSSLATDVSGVAIPALVDAYEAGKLVYSGSYKEPDYELILDLDTQLVIDANNLDGQPDVTEKYTELGIPYLPIRNAKEPHPLGYNEWAKVFGAVLGMWDEANAYFEDCVNRVEALSSLEQSDKSVLMLYFSSDGSKVYVPRGGDSWGKLVELAGGVNGAADYEPGKTGTGTISTEDFYAMFRDVDYIVNMNMAAKLWTLDELLEHEPLLKDFKAVADDHVYICIDRIYQFNYDFAGMISDMNTILSDDSVTETTYFYKAGK